METLSSLRNQVLAWLDEVGDTGTTKLLADYSINKSHATRLTSTNWPFMKWGPITFSYVAGQKEYSLHQEFLRPSYFRNKTQSGVWLVEVPEREVTQTGANRNLDQDGKYFQFGARSQVAAQPSASSVMSIVSSSTGDIGSTKKVTIYGETVDGMASEDINPNGLTVVPGLIAFTRILGVSKASAWSGTLTMTSNAGAVTNLKLFGTEFGRNYQTIQLLFSPTTADVIEYDFYRKPRKLTNDNDQPDIPYPYSLILVWDALLDISADDGRIDGARKAVWEKNQRELEAQMRNDFLEGRSLAARPRHVRDTVGDFGDE
jgi:hypothetical protein